MHISLPCLAVISIFAAGAQDKPVTPDNSVTVRGCVVGSGVYPFLIRDTVKTAIGKARGLMEGWSAIAYIYRTDNQGVSHKIEISLGKIMRRQSPDIELQPGDILDVPFAAGMPPNKTPDILDVPISPPGTGRSS